MGILHLLFHLDSDPEYTSIIGILR